MITPRVGSYAEDIYESLAPIVRKDEQHSWAALIYIGAIGLMFQEVEDLSRDGEGGDPGWSIIMDVKSSPDKALTWLAQFNGVQLIPKRLEQPDAEYGLLMRDRIVDAPGFRRGSLLALIATVRETLLGNRTIYVRERDTSAYHATVVTYQDQTPDPARTAAAIRGQKVGGLIIDLDVIPGQDFYLLRANHTDFNDVMNTYDNFEKVRTNEP